MATIKDVAELAGVSITTVSRVLNAKESQIPISEATQKRVLEAARALQYEPNFMAKALVGQKSDTIGLVMYDLAHVLHPNFSQILHGVATTLSTSKYDLILVPTKRRLGRNEPLHSAIVSYFRQRRVDGVILAAQEIRDEDTLALYEGGFPCVMVGAQVPGTTMPNVRADVRQGMILVTEHLLELGHRRIAFINGPQGFRINDDMASGFQSAMESKGRGGEGHLVNCDFTPEMTRQVALQLLNGTRPPTAIIAADDIMAVDVMQVAFEMGLTVPNDVSVAGFGDLPIASSMTPALTTVRIPISSMGQQATELLIAIMESPSVTVQNQVLPVELVLRGSTGPCSSKVAD